MMQIDFTALDESTGNYAHFDKLTAAASPLTAGSGLLKWYNVAPREQPVAPEVSQLSRHFLTAEIAAGNLAVNGKLGFVVLHRCGNDFYFLLPGIWRNGNELWESVYIKDRDSADFAAYPLPGPNRATYCVWELATVWHERNVWRNYLLSSRDIAAKKAWLADTFEGAC